MASATLSLSSVRSKALVGSRVASQPSRATSISRPSATRTRATFLASATEPTASSVAVSRRTLAASLGLAPLASSGAALAAGVPAGFIPVKDVQDNYAFLYPFGWQEIRIEGQDVAFKDLIEPLESVSVSVLDTQTESLAALGPPSEVAKLFIDKVLTAPGQSFSLLDATSRESEGNQYYTFDFLVDFDSGLQRHALATIAISRGKFYTLITGAESRRWNKVADKLQTVARSFVNLV
mmetsp:Transcript_12370/g.45130  ORF Transcript_12370/g.45130 Transcript_12370/m.45130 type:complete len:237 (+) Transcript_12370:44-754(+)